MVSTHEYLFDLVGGRLCLDFCNIASDFLVSYPALISWSQQAGALTPGRASQLLEHPHDTAQVVATAVQLRGALIALFQFRSRASDLSVLNRALARAYTRQRLVAVRPSGYRLESARSDDAFDEMLWPVARTAADLLTTPAELARVRTCGDETCGQLFLDESKNGSRMWCSMRDCGNRAKARRHYARMKAQ